MRYEVAYATGNVEYQFYAVTPKTEVLNREGPDTEQSDWLLGQFCQAGLTGVRFSKARETLRCRKAILVHLYLKTEECIRLKLPI